jgi:hypothetical protein
MQNGAIEVRDIGAIAALKLLHIGPMEVVINEIQGVQRTVFYFDRSKAEKLLDDYFQYRLSVDARGFAKALRNVRQEIFKNKVNASEAGNGNQGKND